MNVIKENVILVDFPITSNNWEFKAGLESVTEKTWTVLGKTSNQNHGNILNKLIRLIKYFIFPLEILLKRNNYSSVLAWQQFYGLILAFYFRLFKIKNAPQIIVMTFIYKKKKSIIGTVYKKFMDYIVTSGYITKFIVFAESEKKYYSNIFNVTKELFAFTNLGIEDKKNEFELDDEDYYISVGRSNRDYKWLISNWKDSFPKLIIICESLNESNRSNIEILKDCHGNNYLRKMAGCHAVIIPLADNKISSGQLVILQSMMFGKPLIATRNDTIKSYIKNGITGLVIEKNKEQLEAAIMRLNNNETYYKMQIESRKLFECCFSPKKMGEQIGEIINSL